jgi:hypothetical protein
MESEPSTGLRARAVSVLWHPRVASKSSASRGATSPEVESPPGEGRPTGHVHRTSLLGASLFVAAAVLFTLVIGPLGLVVLVAAGLLFWYAVGPGSELSRPNSPG